MKLPNKNKKGIHTPYGKPMEETHIVYILSNKIIQEVTVVSCKLKGLLYNNNNHDNNTFYEY